ncbi:hypothetical protein [Myroides odoratus]
MYDKTFGVFTHCQLSKEEIEEVIASDKLVLFQVGENEFNDNCEFYWAQS